MPTPERPSEDELSHLVPSIARTFIQRWNCYPMQLADGRYMFVKKPLTSTLILDHLKGEVTLGSYVLNCESKARFIVFDADDDDALDQLRRAAPMLNDNGAACYLERSRRGGHLWLFFPMMVSGHRAGIWQRDHCGLPDAQGRALSQAG